MKLKALGAILLGLFAGQAMACYTVYDRSDRIAYRGEAPPVDMSLPLHVALQGRFPGGHMVFDQGIECAPIAAGEVTRAAGGHVPPNTVVFDDGRQRHVAMIPTAAVTASRPAIPDTAAMGAGPSTAYMGAGPATAVMGAAPLSIGASALAPRNMARESSSPLLTDRRTAEAMQLPYTVLSGDAVVVPAHAAR